MTDRTLQDEFDRYYRENGARPPTEGDPEAAAYRTVFAALHEEPEGNLPDDFAERVADRVGLQSEPIIAWSDVILLLLAVFGLGAAVVVMPSLFTVLHDTAGVLLQSLQELSTYVRLDVVGAATLVFALTLGFDALLRRWQPLRRAPTPT